MNEGQKEIKYLIYYYGNDLKNETIIKKALDKLSDINDKITLLQWAGYTLEAKNLMEALNFSEEKFQKLKKLNNNLEKTINLKVLDNKYDFLNDILKVITADINLQQKLLSLDDRKLSILQKLCERVNHKYLLMFTECFLNNMGPSPFENKNIRYNDLNDDLPNDLNNDDLDKLIFLYNSKAKIDVQSYADLQMMDNDSFWKIMLENDRRNGLLARCGFDLNSALELIRKYDVTNIKLTDKDREIYDYILKVVYSSDEDLKGEYLISKDFKSLYMFENNLKKAFLDNINDSLNNGYYLVSVLGAYGKNREIHNYRDLWLRASISPCISCSLISQDNLATAPLKTVIVGFNKMTNNLVNMSEQDINSGAANNDLNEISNIPGSFRCSSDLIAETRSDYNELVFERYGDETLMPDYVLWFKDNINGYDEALKASMDLGIPLVTIDPYVNGENAYLKIESELDSVLDDKSLCFKIIRDFFNNRTGLALHNEVMEEFFSEQRFIEIVSRLKDICPDYLEEALDFEVKKMRKCAVNQNSLNDISLIESVRLRKVK